MAQFDLKKAMVIIRDGTTPTPNEIAIKMATGTCKYDEMRKIEYVKDRGKLDSTREGDQEPVDVTIDATWEWLRSAQGQAVQVEEALKGVGAASSWVSTGLPCEPFAIDIIIEYEPGCGTIYNEMITLPQFRWEKLTHDAKAGMLNTSGKCNTTAATVLRTSQTTA